MIDTPKFCIGPMSKQVVDAVNEYTAESGNKIWFIPSRRQIEWNSGYVNNWSTKSFSKYVDNQNIIMRDHGGPHQGRPGLRRDRGHAAAGLLLRLGAGRHRGRGHAADPDDARQRLSGAAIRSVFS